MKSKKQLDQRGRMKNAQKWLAQADPGNLVTAYRRRYAVSETSATDELAAFGYWDKIQIQHHEQSGIEWEFQYDGYSGEMKVVPKGTPESDRYLF
ncbi:MAG: hypothetical protein U9Q61_00030 [Thermodesulfobacteriota bacterium]|nr:hypothetical protein [Thermodesulfobacteriota bacterium]